ncbi:DUF732 domain-containing protein [Mycolicibacterium austroafricanum]|jgi:hypothetical protein|uniref:DUF732 domain-containing protein n=1 Tax=Mycolicibacterium austroafricanum TaxID=39687 RepID=UPI001CA33985|nr:DUF732 domain-containing protein [Mycolicibacterium austroafricanum]QZT61286.1 DUF732 domain-containing protein [Mycolicibacterium austroafricanum]
MSGLNFTGIRPRRLRRLLTSAALAGMVTVAAITNTATAKADPVDNYTATVAPAVCATLDEFPTFAGILGIGSGIVEDTGWTYREAGRIVAMSVIISCPRHSALVERFATTYTPGVTA